MTGRLVSGVVLAFATALLITGSAVGVAPVVTITSPADAAFVNDDTPTITGTANDASDASAVTVEIWSGSDTLVDPVATQTATPAVGGDWTLDLATPLLDGPYTLIASQTDVDSNLGESAPRSFAVDITNPTGSITAPADATAVSGVTVVSSDSADAGSGVQQVVFESSPASAGTWTTIGADTSAPYSVDWATGSLADGSHYDLRAVTTDVLGHTQTTATVTVLVDNTTPTGSITGPAEATVVSGLTKLSSDSADTSSGVQQVVFESSPASAGTWTTIGTDTGAPYSVDWATGSLADGSYDLRAVTTDLAGNSQSSATVSVVVGNPPAHVDVLTARPLDHRVVITWNNPPDPDFLRVVVRRGTSIVYQGQGESLDDRGLYNGTVYTYTFTAVDSAGNVSPARAVKVEPRGKLLNPRDGGVVRTAPVLKWAKVTRATYYNVQLWRNGRKILSRWPTRPTYELRMRWRYGGRVRNLRDGTYLWYVWPGFGDRDRGRYGRMLGSATFFKR